MQSIELVINKSRSKREHRCTRNRIIRNARRHVDCHVATTAGIGLYQLVVASIFCRCFLKRIVGIKIDNDFVAQLREKKPVGNRNRTHRRHRTTPSEFHDGRKIFTLHRDDSTHCAGTGEFGTECRRWYCRRIQKIGNVSSQLVHGASGRGNSSISRLKDVIIVELKNHLSAANCDFKQISVGWHTRQRDCLCSKNRLRNHRHHLRPEIESEIQLEAAATAKIFCRHRCGTTDLCACFEPRNTRTADRDAIAVVWERFSKTNNDLILIRQIVDRNAAWCDDDVVGVSKCSKWIISSTAASDDNAAERCGVDLYARTESDRDLLRRLVFGDSFGDQRSCVRKCRHEIERHHSARLEIFNVTQIAAPHKRPRTASDSSMKYFPNH